MLHSRLPDPSQPPEEVRRLADEILSRAEFRRPPPSLFERVQEWVGEQLGRVIEGLAGGGRGSLVGILLLAAAVAAVVVLASRAARTVRFEPRTRTAERREPARRAHEWLEEAERAEAAGRWRHGLRCRYRALVAGLAERGVVEDVPGRTVGEHRREVARALPAAAAEFAGASDLFERAWYGDQPTGPGDRDRFGALADRVLDGAAR